MAVTGKFVYMVHLLILLWLNPFDLSVDRDEWWFVIVASLLSGEGAKTYPGLGYLCSEMAVV